MSPDVEQPSARWRLGLVFLLAALSVLLATYGLPRLVVANPAVIKVDLWVSDSSHINVYVNDEVRPPARKDLIAGERRLYVFPTAGDDIRFLRIDPGRVAGARIAVCGIAVEDDQGLVRHFDAFQLLTWSAINVESVEVTDGCFRFRAVNDSPILYTRERVVLHRRGLAVLGELVRAINEPSSVVTVVTIGFVVLLLAGLFDPARRWHPLLAILTVGGTVAFVRWIVPLHHALPPTDQTVGHLALFGLSRQGSMAAVMASVAWGIVVALAATVIHGRPYRRGVSVSALPPPIPEKPPARHRWFLVAGGVLIVLVQLPDFGAQFRDMAQREFFPHWDWNLVTTWSYLSHNGYLPFRDYWYPYSGHYVFDWPAPWGLICLVSYRIALFAVFSRALYTVLGGALLPAFLAVLAILQGESSVFPGLNRYLLAGTLVLAHVAIDRRARRTGAAHLLFWAACALALFLEPTQIVYAAPFIAVSLLLDAWEQWPRWRQLGPGVLLEFGVPIVLLLVALGWATAHGQVPGLRDFYLGLADQADYAAIPTDIVAGTRLPLSTQFLILVAPPLLVSLGLYGRLRFPTGAHRPAELLLGLGLIGIMIFQKHSLRPIDEQLFYVPFLGLLVYGTMIRRRLVEYVLLGVIAGAYVGVMAHSGQLGAWTRSVADAPRRLMEAPGALAQSGLIRDANAQRFAPERFRRFNDEVNVAARIRGMPRDRSAGVFVLTDDPVIYVLLDQRPPYHANIYNYSPIYEQRKVAEWVRTHRPEFVVWNPRNTVFDEVQGWVRAPLVYDAVIDGYVFDQRVGRFDVLRRRAPGEAIPLGYWRERLGPQVTLGHIPRHSSVPRLGPCTGDARERCWPFLQLDVRALVGETPLTVTFKGAGQEFSARLILVPGERTYYVPLDRLWFFTAMERLGSAPTIGFDPSLPNVTMTVIYRVRPPDILY